MEFGLTFLSWVLGAVATILITIWVERLRSPTLRLSIEPPLTFSPKGGFANNWRSLRIRVSNEPLPSWANWIVRLPAQQCRAEIGFLRRDGTPLFEKPMTGRWASSPEPQVALLSNGAGGVVAVLTNPQAIKPTVDVYPDDAEILDIAVRVDGETKCYGWNDETYFHQNWRNPDRELRPELYLLEVTVSSSGRKRREHFRLVNDGPFTAFCLSQIAPSDRQALEALGRT
jgi:hypothetical protein